jgi:DNA recombination protein RmuC
MLPLILLAAVALALLILSLYLLWRPNPLQPRLEELLEERSRLSASLEHARSQLQSDRESAQAQLQADRDSAQAQLQAERDSTQAQLKAERDSTQSQLQKQEQWVRAQTELFEARVLAATGKLMEDSSRSLAERNQKEVTAVVAPFKEQLAEFRQRVDHIYAADTHERGSMKAQIETLTSMNQAMSVQAQRLTNALTVTSKSVGDWGETILGKILEDSGLRKGHEYELQASITGRDGESLRPDAVIRLPESRQLIVDSKVSNKAWTEYCAAIDEVEKEARLREHLLSLRTHMKSLSGKAYTDSPELSTVDFVLMFVPVEAALLTAFVKDPDLYADAYRSRIVLVTPSTLMAVIKLVEGIWTFQKRKESADEIAEAGRKLYEKLTNFAASFISVGRAIRQSSDAFEQAQGQLSTGKGNAIKLAEDMKKLGVTPAAGKQMPAQLLLPHQDEDD